MPTTTDARRIELHENLCDILGSRNVYFQPPESVRMKYPSIVYHIEPGRTRHANNGVYLLRKRYAVTVIDKNPDMNWAETVLKSFEYCEFQRTYVVDNLNHWQFALYY